MDLGAHPVQLGERRVVGDGVHQEVSLQRRRPAAASAVTSGWSRHRRHNQDHNNRLARGSGGQRLVGPHARAAVSVVMACNDYAVPTPHTRLTREHTPRLHLRHQWSASPSSDQHTPPAPRRTTARVRHRRAKFRGQPQAAARRPCAAQPSTGGPHAAALATAPVHNTARQAHGTSAHARRTWPAVSSMVMWRGAPFTSTSLVYTSPIVGQYCSAPGNTRNNEMSIATQRAAARRRWRGVLRARPLRPQHLPPR